MNTAQIYATDIRVAPRFGTGFRNLLATLASRLRERSRRQRDYEHLLELPDYLLEDIGLSRRLVIEGKRRRRF